MPAINITLDDLHVRQSLQALLAAAEHLDPTYDAIGNAIQQSILLNFKEQHDPMGNPWLELSDATLANRRKEGKGAEILRDTGMLNHSITYNVLDHGVEIGSNLVYANMMQFGGKKSDFPWLWGDIPERPFIGINEEDKDEIAAIIQRYLQHASGSY